MRLWELEQPVQSRSGWLSGGMRIWNQMSLTQKPALFATSIHYLELPPTIKNSLVKKIVIHFLKKTVLFLPNWYFSLSAAFKWLYYKVCKSIYLIIQLVAIQCYICFMRVLKCLIFLRAILFPVQGHNKDIADMCHFLSALSCCLLWIQLQQRNP